MTVLSVDLIFEAAIRILVEEDRALSLTLIPGEIRVRFPTTRRLAEFLKVPHYYVLPYFAMMEEGELVTRAERVGILTTAAGTRKLVEIMAGKYRDRASEVLGDPILRELEAKYYR
jgi:DNA-binding transcriptional regulator YhcF (GntR family)